MRHIPDDERRARLARRHALTSDTSAATPEAATRAMTVLHATEPATVYLSCWARVPDVTVPDIDRALFDDRSVAKQLAMRRTVFTAPRDLIPALLASASARVAGTEYARMTKDLLATGVTTDGDGWMAEARRSVLELLAAHPDGLTAAELRTRIPAIDARIEGTAGTWTSSRVLVHLGAAGLICRGANTGHWRVSRPRWTLMEHWIDVPELPSVEDGYEEVVRRWLATFGPGTEDDIVWWLGGTKATVRAALASVDAVAVTLDGGATGWVLPDDVEPEPEVGPWTALLPVLDPTIMGWKSRDFYLAEHHRPHLFDRNGNAGTTAWVDGRAVGTWTQDDAGAVRVHLVDEVDAASRRSLDADAERLTAWLGGIRVGTVYPSPAMKAARAG